MRFVQRLNVQQLGNITDLGTFLFGQKRASLWVDISAHLDGPSRRQLSLLPRELAVAYDVDHFIPWSRYPADLGHNFVLAHPRCNHRQSDFLAAEEHLAAWVERNKCHESEMHEGLLAAALPHDLSASRRIAQWAYEHTEKANGQVWVINDVFRHLSPQWRQLLVA